MPLLKVTAVAMVTLALSLGFVAYRAASVASRKAAGVEEGTGRVVVALQPLRAGEKIEARSVALHRVDLVPEDAYVDPAQVIGQMPAVALGRGEILLAKHFEPDSAIARMLDPDERAVAVKIDGVTGLGGFVRPGDRVDVLFFLRRDGREVVETQARTLLTDVRVLAYGKDVEARGDARPVLDARTAVLAVREADAPLLLLGDTAGKLRLALRHSSEDSGESRRPAPPSATLSDLVPGIAQEAPTSMPGDGAAVRSPIQVIRGHRSEGVGR
jgi:pilus assembly protein CpaB